MLFNGKDIANSLFLTILNYKNFNFPANSLHLIRFEQEN